MDDDKVLGCLVLFILLLLILLALKCMTTTRDVKITEGKVFKLHDATYQCKQVQKLEYGE